MFSASNGLIYSPGSPSEENYFFAGWSLGFDTKYQNLGPKSLDKDENNMDYDSYVYKYGFNNDYTSQVLYE